MVYIFLDLEFNRPIGRVRSKLGFEIIEIGAVKTDENINTIDTFRVYVKNRVYRSINKYVSEMTGITLEDLKQGYDFQKAYKMFRNWIGKEEFKVFSYSNTDEMVLNENLDYNGLQHKKFDEIIDIQREIMMKMNMARQPSLKDSCNVFQVELDNEDEHRSLVDAIMLAKLYKKFLSNTSTSMEIRERVEGKYKDLFDLLGKLSLEQVKELDKRKYKLTCRICKKQLSKDEVYYDDVAGKIYCISSCKECSRNIIQSIKLRKDLITNDIVILKRKYIKKLDTNNPRFKAVYIKQ